MASRAQQAKNVKAQVQAGIRGKQQATPKGSPAKPRTPQNEFGGKGSGRPVNNNVTVTPGTPGTPGVPSPVVQPFMSADDIMNWAAAYKSYNDTLNNADYNTAVQGANTQYGKSQANAQQATGRNATDYNMAGRGMEHSSVRDSELYDIDATAALRRNFLDQQLNTATINSQNQKSAADDAWTTFQKGMNQKMADNAAAAAANLGPWSVNPVAATPGSVTPNKPHNETLHNAPHNRSNQQNPNALHNAPHTPNSNSGRATGPAGGRPYGPG